MDTLAQLKDKLHAAGYVASDEIVQALRAALVLGCPLQVEGPPGVGKIPIAHALSRLLAAALIRIQCYEGIGPEQLLYDDNHAKQLLFISPEDPARWNRGQPDGDRAVEAFRSEPTTPAGASHVQDGSRQPTARELAMARFQGQHVAGIAAKLAG